MSNEHLWMAGGIRHWPHLRTALLMCSGTATVPQAPFFFFSLNKQGQWKVWGSGPAFLFHLHSEDSVAI